MGRRVDQSPERDAATARLLWAAASPTVDVASITASIDAGADIDHAAVTAWSQRCGALFWRAAVHAGVEDALDGDVLALLRNETAVRRCQEELLLPAALQLIIGPLVNAGLEPLLFKGPAVAQLYPEPGLRPMDDIDVILPPSQFNIALSAVKGAGWTEAAERTGEHYDAYLLHPRVPDLPLELHRDIAVRGQRPNRLTGEDLWQLRVPGDCFGASAYLLPPEENLVALAAHAAKPFHQFQRLMWSVDFAVVIGSSDLDWGRVQEFADRNGCATALAVSLRNARRLGARVPTELCEVKGGTARRAALAPVLDDGWPLAAPDPGVSRRLRYALSDSRGSRVALLSGELLAGGIHSAPAQAVRLARLGTRQWWRLRRS